MCACVCMCVNVCMSVHVCECVHVCACACMCVNVCECVCVCLSLHVYMRAWFVRAGMSWQHDQPTHTSQCTCLFTRSCKASASPSLLFMISSMSYTRITRSDELTRKLLYKSQFNNCHNTFSACSRVESLSLIHI